MAAVPQLRSLSLVRLSVLPDHLGDLTALTWLCIDYQARCAALMLP